MKRISRIIVNSFAGNYLYLSFKRWFHRIKRYREKFSPVAISFSQMPSDDSAIFYPEGYDMSLQPPSFSLVNEPKECGELIDTWKIVPQFFSNCTRSRCVLSLEKGTSIYGTGEVTGNLERTGAAVTQWNTDNYFYEKDDGKRLYQSHPWVLAVRKDGSSFGVIADTSYRCEIDLIDGITITSEADQFRVIIIECQSPQLVLQRLGELTGTMELPPLWSLGFQQSRWSYFPDSKVRSIADQFRLRKIPCDVIWMDIDYMNEYRVFTFNEDHFPDPLSTNEYLHEQGFKGVWMIDPGLKIDPEYEVYKSGTAHDVWVKDKDGKDFVGEVWPGDCVFPDFTRPGTCLWWAFLYKRFLSYGIDGVWNDMNEPSVFNGPDGTMPIENHHRGGGDLPAGPHSLYHNVYGMLMVKASRNGILNARPDKRPFLLTRSNFLGGQRYAATWTGDNQSSWKHLKMSIPMVLTMGLSGQPFNGADIGGFGDDADADLFGHWIALGAFYPFCRAHASKDANQKEPWIFGEEIESVARIALERRYRLLPYFYTLFYEASVSGLPVMRPVFFADPGRKKLRSEQQAFLVGGDLLIIPKWAKNVRIPRGFKKKISLVEEDRCNDPYQCDIRIRDGAIVPLTDVVQSTTEFDHSSLTLLIRFDSNDTAVGILYEDENDGFQYRQGRFRLSRYSASKKEGIVELRRERIDGTLSQPERTLMLQLIIDNDCITRTVEDCDCVTVEVRKKHQHVR